MSTSSTSIACGDSFSDDKFTKLDALINECSPKSERNGNAKDNEGDVSGDYLENLIDKIDNENIIKDESNSIKEFKLDNSIKESINLLSEDKSFIENLNLHLDQEDWCICDNLVLHNEKLISIPLKSIGKFKNYFHLNINLLF